MALVWDGLKREANLAKHGFDFADFETSFDRDTALYLPAKPSRTGRERYLVIGDWNGETIVACIVSPLGTEAVSLVSLRKASPTERRAYDHHRSRA